MGADFRITGVDRLGELGAKLKAGDKVLRLELSRNLRAAVAPVKPKLRESALAKLPKAGGLARLVADSKVSIRVAQTGRNVGVRLTAKNTDNITRLDKGSVRHKTFGKPPWQTQAVEPDWFTQPTEDAKPQIMAAAKAALDATARKLEP